MILADTSIWIDHLRHTQTTLQRLLHHGQVAVHPFVIGEIACGTLRHRNEILGLLAELPVLTIATYEEVLILLHRYRLHGKGLGWIDMHLLASSLLNHTVIWTIDKRLARAAGELNIEANM